MTAAHLFARVSKLTLVRRLDGLFAAEAALALCHLHLSHMTESVLQPILEVAQDRSSLRCAKWREGQDRVPEVARHGVGLAGVEVMPQCAGQ
jgi:hypothetical protein